MRLTSTLWRRSRSSRGSRRWCGGSDRQTAQAAPRWADRGPSSCTAQRAPGADEGWRHHATGQRQVAGRSRAARTTTPHHAAVSASGSSSSGPERGQVTPSIDFVQRMVVIGVVCRVEHRTPVMLEKGAERLVDDGSIRLASEGGASVGEQLLIHGGADPNTRHGMIMHVGSRRVGSHTGATGRTTNGVHGGHSVGWPLVAEGARRPGR